MSQTVVGMFKSATEAQSLKHDLVGEGFAAESMQVIGQEEGSVSKTSSTAAGVSEGQGTGVLASIKNFFGANSEADQQKYSEGVNQGHAILAITVPDDRAQAVQERLEKAGAVNVEQRAATGETSRNATSSADVTGEQSIPVIEEDLLVGKRQVSRGGVRVTSHVVETPVEESIQLREEHVQVQRSAVNRPATAADFETFKEGTIELTETAEEAVISKQARVVEEVMVGKDVSERTQTVSENLRHTEVEVEDLAGNRVKSTTASVK